MKLLSIALGTMLLVPATAVADKDCPKTYKPRPRAKRKPAPPKVVPQTPCDCVGKEGPIGPQGPKGDPGEPGNLVIENLTVIDEMTPKVDLRIGVMGNVQGPHGDWEWGPALQLKQALSSRYELLLSAGLGAGLSEGRQSGYMVQLDVSRQVSGDRNGDGVALSVGLNKTHIRGSSDNGEIDGDYLSAVGGITVHTRRVRLTVGPTLGGLQDDSEPGTQLAFGVQGSAFIGWGW